MPSRRGIFTLFQALCDYVLWSSAEDLKYGALTVLSKLSDSIAVAKIPTDAGTCHKIPTDAGTYHKIPTDAGTYHKIPTDAGTYHKIPTCRYLP